MKHITYDSGTNRWNFFNVRGEVKVYSRGDVIPASTAGVVAATYAEAFEKLTGMPYQF